MQSRREWFKSSIGLGGLMITPSILTAEEIKKYNPRPLSDIVKLSSNENPYGPSERVRNAIIDSFEVIQINTVLLSKNPMHFLPLSNATDTFIKAKLRCKGYGN